MDSFKAHVQYIKLTDLNLALEFDTFNHKYFNSKLPKIPIELKNIKPHGLCLSWKYKSTKRIEVQKIILSIRYKWTYEEFKNVLIHEMIHAELAIDQVYDFGGQHGIFFTKRMRELNEKFNLKISHNVENETIVATENNKVYTVFLVHKTDGTKTILKCDSKYADMFLNETLNFYKDRRKEIFEITSDNNQLLKYPSLRSKKNSRFYKISDIIYNELLDSSISKIRYR